MDFVDLDAHDLHNRFDQARMKTDQGTLYGTAGHVLYSRRNQVIMTIKEDTFEGPMTPRKGMRSRGVHELPVRKSLLESSLRDISKRSCRTTAPERT